MYVWGDGAMGMEEGVINLAYLNFGQIHAQSELRISVP